MKTGYAARIIQRGEELFGSRSAMSVLALVAVSSACFLLWQGPQPCDDAYINFRHARHIASDLTPSWNLEGQRVMGGTPVAFVFILGGLSYLLHIEQIELLALVLNALLLLAIVPLVYLVVRELVERTGPAVLATILIAFNSTNVLVFSFGFEAALLTCVLLGCLYGVRHGHHSLAALLAGLGPFLRPEGILLSIPVWALILSRRRVQLRSLCLYALLPLAWTVFASIYYGSVWPQPLRAKQMWSAIYRPYTDAKLDVFSRLADLPSHVGSLWFDSAGPLLLTSHLDAGESFVLPWLEWALLLSSLAFLVSLIRARDARWVYLFYPPAFLLLYALLGQTQVWYFPSFLTFSWILAFCSVVFIYDQTLGRLRATSSVGRAIGLGVFFVLCLSTNRYHLNSGIHRDPSKASLYAHDARGEAWPSWERERFLVYRDAARWLVDNGSPAESVLTSEVGVFGYFYPGPVIDPAGLCSPEALRYYPPPRDEIYDEQGRFRTRANSFVPAAMVAELQPRYVVNSLVYMDPLLQLEGSFRSSYAKRTCRGRAWRRPVCIFERVR